VCERGWDPARQTFTQYYALASEFVVTGPGRLVLAALQRAATGRDDDATWPARAPFLGGGVPETHAWHRYHARSFPLLLVFLALELKRRPGWDS
jgi:NADH-quinone oxidoreductase subunit A